MITSWSFAHKLTTNTFLTFHCRGGECSKKKQGNVVKPSMVFDVKEVEKGAADKVQNVAKCAG